MNPIKIGAAAPDEEVVAAIKDALDLARNGELRDVAIVGSLTENRTFTTYSCDDLIQMVGMCTFLQSRLCAGLPRLDSPPEPDPKGPGT